ncbi:hypothetical protein JX266_000007 [Neoarthrinium moseri]|nr:hypothetical protein JX266_000007 [Neoarthrinium moseri]
MADTQIIHAYRHLYRHGLRAVQFSKPSRYTFRDQLRKAFRDRDAKFDPSSISRTVEFLEAATRTRGLEHKVLKNLLHVAWHRYRPRNLKYRMLDQQKTDEFNKQIRVAGYKQYDMTIAMLNKSMGLCLRG